MINNYAEFKAALQKSGDSADHSTRQRYNKELLEFRGKSPEQYQKYMNRVRQETKGQNIVKC
jgi:hypothetical protein